MNIKIIGIYVSAAVLALGLSTLTSDVEILEKYQTQLLWVGGLPLFLASRLASDLF